MGSVVNVGARAKSWCLPIHAEASRSVGSYGGRNGGGGMGGAEHVASPAAYPSSTP